MNKHFLLILIFISCELYPQDLNIPLLNSEFIKAKNPSEADLFHIVKIDSTMKMFNDEYGNKIHEYFQTYDEIDSFKYDYSPTSDFLKKFVYGDYGLVVKQFAAFKLSDLLTTTYKIKEKDPTFAYDCLEILKADDIVWSMNPEGIIFFNNLRTNLALQNYIKNKNKPVTEWSQEEKDSYEQFLINEDLSFGNELYKKNPDKKVRAFALIYIIQMLHSLGRKDIASEYYYKLSNEFSDVEDAKNILIEYNPSGKLIPGKQVPSFQGELINSNNKISSEMLKGKYYLIYFWATWCGPCIIKMEKLHKIYNKYKDSGFTIVAFSLDYSDETVEKFQKEKWEMPWFNLRLKGGFEDEIAKEFELSYVPKMLFVNSEGIIIEDNSSIKYDIDSTISKYLSEHK